VSKAHFACENRTLRVEIPLVGVEITLGRVFFKKINACLSKNIFKNRHLIKFKMAAKTQIEFRKTKLIFFLLDSKIKNAKWR
jgi:hypothetical protein